MELNTRVKREQGRPAYLLSGPLLESIPVAYVYLSASHHPSIRQQNAYITSVPGPSDPAPKLVGRCGEYLEWPRLNNPIRKTNGNPKESPIVSHKRLGPKRMFL